MWILDELKLKIDKKGGGRGNFSYNVNSHKQTITEAVIWSLTDSHQCFYCVLLKIGRHVSTMDFPFSDGHVGGRQWGMGLGLPIVLNLCFSEVLNRVDPTGPTPKCGRPKFGQSNPLEHSYPSRQIFNYIITKIPPLPPPLLFVYFKF